MRSIYLDYNASTPLAPAAQQAMLPYLADRFADPAGDHPPGRAIGEAIEDARLRVAEAIGARPAEIVWTSGGTESCNLALRGLIEPRARAGERPHLIVSAVEHAAVAGPARFLASVGAELTVVPCDGDGRTDPRSVVEALRPSTRLVSVVHANDEIGAVQPIAAIASACHDEGVPLHVDASQTLGKLPIDVAALGADLLSLSAHKAYGPKGAGALYVRTGADPEPLLHGDGQEGGLRPGTPNVAGLVGFGHAARLAGQAANDWGERATRLRDRLTSRVLEGAGAGRLYGSAAERLPNTVVVALPGAPALDLLNATPEVAAKACAGGAALSPTLRAIGADPAEATGAIRLSIGWYTDEEEVDAAADALVEAWRRLV